MSISILTPTDDAGDFDRWEQELNGDTRPVYRPTRAAERRAALQQIDEALGIRRHRTHEREA
jgi:hypothetical protein